MHALFIVFTVGVFVALLRFDPDVELYKAGSFTTVAGVPIRFLMAGYRLVTVGVLYLAFTLPLGYRVDRSLFLQCLSLSWVFSVVIAVCGVMDYAGIAELDFAGRREAGYGHILGFHRGSLGMMLVTGIFLGFTMTQVTKSYALKVLGYASGPLLLLGLLFSWSRSAAMGLGVGALSLALTLGGGRALKGLLLSILGAFTAWLILMQSPELAERFTTLAGGTIESASAGRLTNWMQLMAWLAQNPGMLLTGAGFQNFHYFVHLQSAAVTLSAGHNNYLHILTESGLIGFGVFMGWLASIFLWLNSWRRAITDRQRRAVPGIFMSLVVAIAVSCLTQESLAPSFSMTPYVLHFYLILGIWISHYRTEMIEACSVPLARPAPFLATQRRAPAVRVSTDVGQSEHA